MPNFVSKENIKKILKSKALKVATTIFLVILAISSLAASTFVSYKNQNAKNEKIMKQRMKNEAPKPKAIIDRSKYKKINLSNEDMGRLNPYIPISNSTEVPTESLVMDKYIMTPPEAGTPDSPTGTIMGTTVSGIMYDGLNPSAVINIEGNEYFVKRNDVVNKYKILSITPKQVVVQYDRNIYMAGVGELLTEVKSNSNIVNIDKKFGGNISGNIPINVRKR